MKKTGKFSIYFENGKIESWDNITLKEISKLIGKHAPQYLDKFDDRISKIRYIQKNILTDADRLEEYTEILKKSAATCGQINENLEGLSDKKMIKKLEEYRNYIDLGSAILRANPVSMPGGRAAFVFAWIPSLRWWPWRFNNTAQSHYYWGLNFYFTRTWWRGNWEVKLGIFSPGTIVPLDDFTPALSGNVSSYIG